MKETNVDLFSHPLSKTESQIKDKIKVLEAEQKEMNLKHIKLQEDLRAAKARRTFIPKGEFLIREQLQRMENFIVSLNEFLKKGDSESIMATMKRELREIHNMNIYMASDHSLDILYDYTQQPVYRKIKRNVDNEGTDEKLGNIEIRKTDWIPFQRNERGEESDRDN